MTIEVSLALLAFAAPVTAAVFKFCPAWNKPDGFYKYVSLREYDAFKVDVGRRLDEIRTDLRELNNFLRSRLQ